ncbi:MAG: hypothetical protein U1F41_08790 [Burkholderiales bacterium]
MKVIDYPLLLLLPVSFVMMAAASWCGAWFAARRSTQAIDARDDFGVILAATLTLLGLIIGFTFSMALTRYDQRKNLEEEEANAIGTEYLRLDLLPPAAADKARALLRDYTRERILFYTTRDEAALEEIAVRTAKLQADLWAAVRDPAQNQRDPVSVMIMIGMNDVINSQGYAQAAWWNRIPRAAWLLMAAMALCANFMVGRNAKHPKSELRLLLVLPFVVSIAFFLIGDIDAPHAGVIRVVPQNLNALLPTLR